MICPLIKRVEDIAERDNDLIRQCRKDCAWWMNYSNNCAIALIADTLSVEEITEAKNA